MEWMPKLEIGLLNGWVLLLFEFLIQGGLLLAFPKDVVTRLFDRSGWTRKQRIFTIIGKLFSLACLILIILSPIKIGSTVFIIGLIFYITGLVALVVAMLDFRNTPLDQPVMRGIYRFSRHPQLVALFVIFLGICLSIGSWAALFTLVVSRLLQHFGILAEEEACLKKYGNPYRAYMDRVPRYLLFF